jgi:DNA-binding response OmpR family regulator
MLIASEESIVRSFETGANDYAVKPFPLLPFVSRMRRMLTHGERKRESSRTSILIIDHETPQLLVAGSTLHKQVGCRVLLAKGHKDGLKRLLEDHPGIVILDMHLPGATGREFLGMIPATDQTKRTTIIPAINAAESSLRLESEVFRITSPVSRPYRPGSFMEQLRKVLSAEQLDVPPEVADERHFSSEIQRVL